MEIKDKDFHVWYDEDTQTVICQGALRLAGMEEYAPIAQLLDAVSQQKLPALKLNLTELAFLNSSGINTLSKFVLKMRQQPNTQFIVQGSNDIPWQAKSLPNLKRLMPAMELQFQ